MCDLSNGLNSSEIHWRPTVFSRTTASWTEETVWNKRPFTSQISRNQTNSLLNSKHVLTFPKTHDSENRTKCYEVSFSGKSSSICLGGFQNFYGPLTPLYLPFFPLFTGIFKRLPSACHILFWVCVTDVLQLSSQTYRSRGTILKMLKELYPRILIYSWISYTWQVFELWCYNGMRLVGVFVGVECIFHLAGRDCDIGG